jgi:hypothetical protein
MFTFRRFTAGKNSSATLKLRTSTTSVGTEEAPMDTQNKQTVEQAEAPVGQATREKEREKQHEGQELALEDLEGVPDKEEAPGGQ